MKLKQSLVFNDVLLRPKFSDIKSRKDVDLSTDLGKGVKLKIPVVSSNMVNVTGVEMAKALSALGGLPILHRFFDYETIPSIYTEASSGTDFVGASIGIQEKDKELAKKLVDVGCKIICIDVAHGHSKDTGAMTNWVAKTFPEVLLISGNVATREGALYLADKGADVVKIGIGPSMICTTRIMTGNGVGQLSALDDCYEVAKKHGFKIIADGGITNSGNLCKALCFSHAVMLGGLLASATEAPGELVQIGEKWYKPFNGSSTLKSSHREGVEAMVEHKGSVESILTSLLEGVSSGLSYQGASSLEELREDPEFELISNAGLIESNAHDVRVVR